MALRSMIGRPRAADSLPIPPARRCLECPMCRAAISAATIAGVCSSCPLYHMTSGCRIDLIACPQCGYHSLPQEHSPARRAPSKASSDGRSVASVGEIAAGPSAGIAGAVEHSATTPENGSAAICAGAIALSEMRSGSRARVLGFRGIDDNYLGRLTAYGLLPGVNIEVLQRFPAIILGVYQAELALEMELAEGIWVLPS